MLYPLQLSVSKSNNCHLEPAICPSNYNRTVGSIVANLQPPESIRREKAAGHTDDIEIAPDTVRPPVQQRAKGDKASDILSVDNLISACVEDRSTTAKMKDGNS